MEVTAGDHLPASAKTSGLLGHRVGLGQQYPLSSDVTGSNKRPLPVAGSEGIRVLNFMTVVM